MKNRFVIFAGQFFYPDRNSIICAKSTLEEAKTQIKIDGIDGLEVCGEPYEWVHIIDMETLKEVYYYKITV